MPGNVGNIDPSGWPMPNYTNPVHRAWMPAYVGVLFTVATAMVGTRIWLRFARKAGSPGLDDLFLVFAWVAGLVFTVCTIVTTVHYDVSRHTWDVLPQNFENILKFVWIQEFAFLVCGCCVKIAVLLFYRRLVEGTYCRRWKYGVFVAIGFTVFYSLAFILALIFNCTPTVAYWRAFDPTYTHPYTCVDTTSINVLAGLAAAISDLYSVVLPCAMTSTFQLRKQQKIALYVIFCLGLLIVVASSVRTVYLWQVGHKNDVVWILYNVMVWSELELQLALMCCSAPAMRVLFRTYLNPPLGRVIRSGGSSGRSNSQKLESSHAPEFKRAQPRRISDPYSRPNLFEGPPERGSVEVNIRYSPPPRPAHIFRMQKVGTKEVYTMQDLEMSVEPPRREQQKSPFRNSFFS